VLSLSEEERILLLLPAGVSSRAEVDEADQRHSSSGDSSFRQRYCDPAGGVTPAAKTPTAVATTAALNVDIRV
jgi:hypothetical protein